MRNVLFLLVVVFFASCAPVEVGASKPAVYKVETTRIEHGIASWYRDHRTASGEKFNVHAMTAAHKTLPFGTKVRVVDLKTNKSVIVRINDRGPYIRGRCIDLTVGAARELGMYHRGIAKVRLEVLREIPVLKSPNLRVNARADEESERRDYVANAPQQREVVR